MKDQLQGNLDSSLIEKCLKNVAWCGQELKQLWPEMGGKDSGSWTGKSWPEGQVQPNGGWSQGTLQGPDFPLRGQR